MKQNRTPAKKAIETDRKAIESVWIWRGTCLSFFSLTRDDGYAFDRDFDATARIRKAQKP